MDVDNPDSILLGADERGYFLTARGSIRASLCYALRERLLDRLEDSADVPAVFADLSECVYMDSTFIGLLVAVDRRLRKGSGGRLHILRPSRQCLDLLDQMGLQKLLLIEPGEAPVLPEMSELEKPVDRPATEFVLRAHEELMETSDKAREKFALLREELERKLRAEKPPEGTR